MAGVQSNGLEPQAYQANGYVLLEQLFPPLVLAIFHGKLQNDLNLKDDPKFLTHTPLLTKPALHVYSRQYAPMATFHWGLTPTAAAIAGCELIPTYAYFRVYQQDDVCLVHPDRSACEHSMSLMLELADDKAWALCIAKDHVEAHAPSADQNFRSDEAFAELPMRAGDAVMYRGVNHRHGRIEPNPNRWSAHLFLHWVDANGPFADQAFDRVAVKAAMAQTP
ncbi:MAG: hypothetical protein V4491_03470 [Pseudomonadota bacterium]